MSLLSEWQVHRGAVVGRVSRGDQGMVRTSPLCPCYPPNDRLFRIPWISDSYVKVDDRKRARSPEEGSLLSTVFGYFYLLDYMQRKTKSFISYTIITFDHRRKLSTNRGVLEQYIFSVLSTFWSWVVWSDSLVDNV